MTAWRQTPQQREDDQRRGPEPLGNILNRYGYGYVQLMAPLGELPEDRKPQQADECPPTFVQRKLF